jgi:hypothetical protein
MRSIHLMTVILAWALWPQTAEAQTKRALTAPEKAAVAREVRAGLKDPGSATFKWPLWITTKTSGEMNLSYCGLVNAKNSLGGYRGDAPFMVALVPKGERAGAPVSSVVLLAVEELDSGAVRKVCVEEGYSLSRLK